MWNNIRRLIILSIILIPNWANAENAEEGLVKCGVDRDCTVCDMFILVRDIMNYLFQLLGVVAVISVIIGGFYMVISSGDQGKYKQGVDIIKNAILGIVVTLSAFIMFNFILVGLGFQVSNIGFGGGDVESDALQFEQEGQDFSLFRVKCDSTSYFLEREVNLAGGGTSVVGESVATSTSSSTASPGEVTSTIKGIASYYGPGFHGRKTANGETFDQNAMTAAHRSLPFGTKIKVTYIKNGKSVEVRINDRGPFTKDGAGNYLRIIDLSQGAAEAVGMKSAGTGEVKLEILK